MDIPDDLLVAMFRVDARNVPITMIGRCLRLLDDEDRGVLIASITQRRPRNDLERETLLSLALNRRVGGVLFVEKLGGFDKQQPC